MANVTDEILRASFEADIADAKKVAGALTDIADSSGDIGDESDSASKKSDKFERSLASLADTSLILQGAFSAAQKGLGLLKSGFDAVIGASLDSQAQLGLLEAQTGASGAELQAYRNIADEIFNSNWGESQEDVNAALQRTRNITHLTGDALQDMTTDALFLRDTFDKDIAESVRAADTIMEAFGEDGNAAFDIITRGLQTTGDPADDLLDTFNEYSNNFAQMGFSAQGTLNLLNQGLQNGARNTDDIADAMREFQIRLLDGSSESALNSLGDATRYNLGLFEEGGGNAAMVFEAMIGDLRSIEDETARNAAGVAIFGTRWEDMGEEALLALDPTSDSLGEVEGAADRAQAAVSRGIVPAFSSMFRTISTGVTRSLEPYITSFTDSLVPATEQFTAFLTSEGIPALINIGRWLFDAGRDALSFGNAILTAVGGSDAVFSRIGDIGQGIASLVDALGSLSPESITLIGVGLAIMTGPAILGGMAALAAGIAATAVALAPVALLIGVIAAYESDFGGLKTNVQAFGTAIREGDLPGAVTALANAMIAIPKGLATEFGDLVGIDVEGGLSAWGGIFENIGTFIGTAKTNAQGLISQLGIMVGALPGVLEPLAANVGGFLLSPFTSAISSIEGIFGIEEGSIRSAITTFITGLPGTLATLPGTVTTGLSNAFTSAVDTVKKLFTTEPGTILGNLTEFVSTGISTALTGLSAMLTTTLGSPFQNIVSAITAPFSAIGGEGSIIATITSFFAALPAMITGMFAGEGAAVDVGTISAWVDTNIVTPFIESLNVLATKIPETIDAAIPDIFSIELPEVRIGLGPLGSTTIGGYSINMDLPDTPLKDLGLYQQGGSFTVPGSGNGDQPFLIGLEPGEHVNVTSRRESGGGGGVMQPIVLQLDGRTVYETIVEIHGGRA